MRNRVKRAFTLIEILIVVVILGILAAIVIPQFTDASEDAMDASVRSQLQTVRAQIELFQVQNPDVTLTVGNLFTQLVENDYLQQAPRNPLQGGSTTVAADAAEGVGWTWDGDDFGAVGADDAAFDES
jgi:prepilin-type N-terminal cleavage/methylation domain-containing protein